MSPQSEKKDWDPTTKAVATLLAATIDLDSKLQYVAGRFTADHVAVAAFREALSKAKRRLLT